MMNFYLDKKRNYNLGPVKNDRVPQNNNLGPLRMIRDRLNNDQVPVDR